MSAWVWWRAHGEPWGRGVPSALDAGAGAGGLAFVGGAADFGDARGGDGVFFGVLFALRFLPEREHQQRGEGKVVTVERLRRYSGVWRGRGRTIWIW